MKLFVVAALIAVSAAARLEHLERGYLPPNGQGQVANDFGNNGQFGSQQGFGGQRGFGAQQGGASGLAARNGGNFGAATSNQYLPPNQGPAGNDLSNGRTPCCGQNAQEVDSAFGQQLNQFGAAANGGVQPFGGARQAGQYQPQLGAASRQYLAPKGFNDGNNFQNIPQQEFDEQTGYKY